MRKFFELIRRVSNFKLFKASLTFAIENTLYNSYSKSGVVTDGLKKLDISPVIDELIFKSRYPVAEDELCLICPWGIGDTIFVAGLVNAIKQKYGIKKVALLIKPGHYDVVKAFDGIDRVDFLDEEITYMERNSNAFVVKSQSLSSGNYFFAHFEYNTLAWLTGYRDNTMFDSYKLLFNLHPLVTLQKPHLNIPGGVEHSRKLFDENKLTVNRTVLLSIGANSIESFPTQFWINVCKILSEQKFTLVINAPDMPAEFEEYAICLDIPLKYLPAFAERAGYVIALRSGICDYLSFVDINLTVLYPSRSWLSGTLFEGTSLAKMGLAEHAHEFEIQQGELENEKFFSYINKLGKN